MRVPFVTATLVALALSGCGGSEAGGQPETPPTTAAATGTSALPSTTTTSARPLPSSDGLTGYGATREAWDAAHRPAPGFEPSAAFLPLVRGDQPRYYAVSGSPGERIYSYSMAFEEGTSLAEAKQQVLLEFPRGAKFDLTDDDEARCLLVRIKSAQVEKTLDDAQPMVGFFSLPEADSPFTPNDVREAIFTLAFPDEARDLGMC